MNSEISVGVGPTSERILNRISSILWSGITKSSSVGQSETRSAVPLVADPSGSGHTKMEVD